ncbi:hypothetical protein WJX73_000171 [Symbiochloris irregularis]|uniref:Large ribosomal subunit protein uL6c n=1 Tax=Symbiochloris irregularis TaxID=706552 RepID=A0AAW1P446_9CHLO
MAHAPCLHSHFLGNGRTLTPASHISLRHRSQCASITECKESRIGKQPVGVPKGVEVKQEGLTFSVKGPKGELTQTFSPLVKFEKLEDGSYRLYMAKDTRESHAFHGLSRALLNNMVVGVSEGFSKTLSLRGVGYRATLDGDSINLNLGYSQLVKIKIPKGIEVKVERLTTVHISGFNKSEVGQFAAIIRSKREPEPYKGKGVRYIDEFVRQKAGKRR